MKDAASARWTVNRIRPLRVLQVIASVADVNGGASTAIWATLKALETRNISSELVTTNEDGPHRAMDVPTGEFIHHGGHRVLFFPYLGDRYTTSWPMAKWLFEHARDYDLIHVHGLFRFAPVVASHIALARGVPYVLTLHNTLGQWGMQHRRPLLKKLSLRLVEGRVLDRARKVHLCSSDELSQVARIRALGERSCVFPLGIDLPEEPHDRHDRETASDLGALAGRTVVLFMSRIHEIKGLDKLLTAFAAVRRQGSDAVLAIAGTGDAPLVTRLMHMAKELGIDAHIHWLGFVQGQRKHELLSRAALFVLPSHSENFGYAVVEALLAGLPVITTINVPSGKFVIESNAGIVYDGTTERLEQSILQILNMPENQRRSLGTRGPATIRERLSLQSFGASLEKVYQEAIGPR
jgi:glycosyltransferase involved in cell wall biosynthesis